MQNEKPAQNDERTDTQFDWLFQGLNDISGSGQIARHLEQFVISDHELLINGLVNGIRRGNCPAETKPQFLRWCQRQLDQHADSLIPFFLAKRIKETTGRLTVSDVMNIASVHGRTRKGLRTFPRVILNRDVALVDVACGILKVPAKADSDSPAENFLPILELLWPWTVRADRVEKHCARQSYATGRMLPHRIALHRLFLDFVHGNTSDAPIVARDGDFLNWTGNNLLRKGTEGSIPEHLFLPVAQGRDGDLWPLCSTTTADPTTGAPVSQLPARAVRPRGAGPDTGADSEHPYLRTETLHPKRGTTLP